MLIYISQLSENLEVLYAVYMAIETFIFLLDLHFLLLLLWKINKMYFLVFKWETNFFILGECHSGWSC